MKLALALLLAVTPIVHAGNAFELEPNILVTCEIYEIPRKLSIDHPELDAASMVSSGSAQIQSILAIASRHGVRAVTKGPGAQMDIEPILFPDSHKLDLHTEVTRDGWKFEKDSSAPMKMPIFAGALERDNKTIFAFLRPGLERTAAPDKFERNLETIALSCDLFEVSETLAQAFLTPQEGVIDIAQMLYGLLRVQAEKGAVESQSISGIKAPNGQNTLKVEGDNSLRVEPIVSPDGQLIDINLHLIVGKSELMTTALMKYGHTSFLGTLRSSKENHVVLAFLNTAK